MSSKHDEILLGYFQWFLPTQKLILSQEIPKPSDVHFMDI